MTERVVKANLRTYNVGFGDCLLLSLTYDDGESRHVLIDFGTTKRPRNATPKHMVLVAENIAAKCGGKLHMVVATHRHADHISGFAGKPGAIIAALRPDIVVQPWTEAPGIQPDALAPSATAHRDSRGLARTLANMSVLAGAIRDAGTMLSASSGLPKALGARLQFLGETNLTNEAAVKTLAVMGARQEYVRFGSKLAIKKILPGVTIEVLGPPTVEQHPEMGSEATKDAQEFWHLAAGRVRDLPVGASGGRLFPNAPRSVAPQSARWLIPRIERAAADEMLSLVRTLDGVLNNTSLILLLHIGKTALLFPGDAQIENWRYALFKAPNSMTSGNGWRTPGCTRSATTAASTPLRRPSGTGSNAPSRVRRRRIVSSRFCRLPKVFTAMPARTPKCLVRRSSTRSTPSRC